MEGGFVLPLCVGRSHYEKGWADGQSKEMTGARSCGW